jgi:hypothetical protein
MKILISTLSAIFLFAGSIYAFTIKGLSADISVTSNGQTNEYKHGDDIDIDNKSEIKVLSNDTLEFKLNDFKIKARGGTHFDMILVGNTLTFQTRETSDSLQIIFRDISIILNEKSSINITPEELALKLQATGGRIILTRPPNNLKILTAGNSLNVKLESKDLNDYSPPAETIEETPPAEDSIEEVSNPDTKPSVLEETQQPETANTKE